MAREWGNPDSAKATEAEQAHPDHATGVHAGPA